MNQVCVDCNDVYVYIFSEFTSEKQRHFMADKRDRPDQYPHGALLHIHWAPLGLERAAKDLCSTMRGRIKGADSTINAIPRTTVQ